MTTRLTTWLAAALVFLAGSAHAQLVAPSARERAAALAQKDAVRAAQLIAGWLVEPPAMESKSP